MEMNIADFLDLHLLLFVIFASSVCIFVPVSYSFSFLNFIAKYTLHL